MLGGKSCGCWCDVHGCFMAIDWSEAGHTRALSWPLRSLPFCTHNQGAQQEYPKGLESHPQSVGVYQLATTQGQDHTHSKVCFLVGFPRRKSRGELLGTSGLRKCLQEKPEECREQDRKREEATSVASNVASAWSQEGLSRSGRSVTPSGAKSHDLHQSVAGCGDFNSLNRQAGTCSPQAVI